MEIRKVPKDTQEILNSFKEIDNFHLKLNKFAKFDKNKGYKLQNQNINKDFFKENLEFYKLKINEYYQNIEKLNLKFSEFSLRIDYRLIIGSEQSIYETSIRLHHIYGIPYIPASGIKGVVRSYLEQEKKLDRYIDLFGDEDKEGKIIFFDAFPISQPKIKVDIMNPHYGDYYNKNEAPTDTQKLNPINFLTVEDTTFGFIIASRDEIDNSFILLFEKALKDHGIGGKTAVGYGYFD